MGNYWQIYGALCLQFLWLYVHGTPDCTVSEGSSRGTVVCSRLTGVKTGDKVTVTDPRSPFEVREIGAGRMMSLVVKKIIDREELGERGVCEAEEWRSRKLCFVIVELAKVQPPPEQHTFFHVKIEILDMNDNAPNFHRTEFTVNIDENSPEGETRELPLATDPDNGYNSTITYSLQGELANNFDLIPPVPSQGGSLQLKTRVKFDREVTKDPINLLLIAKDTGRPPLTGTLSVQVVIRDVNDNWPVFGDTVSHLIQVNEDTRKDTTIAHITATDADEEGGVIIKIPPSAGPMIARKFYITPTGDLKLASQLDYDTEIRSYVLPLIAVDSGVPPHTATTTLSIRVVDVNDNAPQIAFSSTASTSSNTFTVMENLPVNSFVLRFTASDPDSGIFGEVSCRLDDAPKFALESVETGGGGMSGHRRSYQMVTTAKLDREERSSYVVKVVCTDGASSAKSTVQTVTIKVGDINDKAPVFIQRFLHVNLAENEPPGTKVVKLEAHDADEGDNARIIYELVPPTNNQGPYFVINKDSGIVHTLVSFDREHISTHTFTAIARDSRDPLLNSSITVTVHITDENDCVPIFKKHFEFSVLEGSKLPIGKVEAEDCDLDHRGRLTYSLGPDFIGRHLWKVYHDGSLQAAPSAALDRETAAVHYVVIQAVDHGTPQHTGTTTVTVRVLDVNDNTPKFISPPTHHEIINITQDMPPGSIIYTAEAVDKDEGENARIHYFLTRQATDHFIIEEDTGHIRLNKSLRRDANFQNKLVICARDSGNSSSTAFIILGIRVVGGSSDYGGGIGGGLGGGSGRRGLSRNMVISIGGSLVLLIFICLALLVVYCCHTLYKVPRKENPHLEKAGNNQSGWFSRLQASLYPASDPEGHNGDSKHGIPRDDYRVIPGQPSHSLKEDAYMGKQEVLVHESGPMMYSHLGEHPYHFPEDAEERCYWEYSTIPHLQGASSYDLKQHTQYGHIAGVNPTAQRRHIQSRDMATYNTYHQAGEPFTGTNNNESASSEEVTGILNRSMNPSSNQSSRLGGIGGKKGTSMESGVSMGYQNDSKTMLASATSVTSSTVSGRQYRHAGYVVGSPCYATSFV